MKSVPSEEIWENYYVNYQLSFQSNNFYSHMNSIYQNWRRPN